MVARPTRREFLLGAGLLVASAHVGCSAPPEPAREDGWLFGPYQAGSTELDFDESSLTPVELPHCAPELSWWRWHPRDWDRVWVYRCHRPELPRGQREVVHFDGVLSAAEVFVNGQRVGGRVGGYLPFECELTDRLTRPDNVVAVVVDSRWGLDVPPDRPEPQKPWSIDFYQPGGLVRGVEFRRLPQVFCTELHAKPENVGGPDPRVTVTGKLDSGHLAGTFDVSAQLVDGAQVLAEGATRVRTAGDELAPFTITLQDLPEVQLWDLDSPKLYEVLVNTPGGQSRVRIGFRDLRFEVDGFYLNGRRVQLFGLNRHEWYPYVGAAMPDRVHRRDAQILKEELNCAMVRCSHYPQSEAFLDACDELGLLVWEEAPGWDYIGDQTWRDRVLRDVSGMVLRDRNHPSIIAWGTRLNETEDDVALYSKTRAIANELDGTRATTGAVNSSVVAQGPVVPTPFRDPFATTPLVQDVFAFNDYLVPPPGQLPTLREPRTDLPYMVSEAVGVLTGAKAFRRTSPVRVQADQGVLHAAVHDKAMSTPQYMGLLGWCAFDYPSGYGNAEDSIKWAGVCDFFREPKLGAGFYQSQTDPANRPVIVPAFYWGPDTGPMADAVIWSNCDRLEVRVNGVAVPPPRLDRDRFPHLRHPPFLVSLPAASGDLRIDGWVGQQLVASRRFSADPRQDELQLFTDDQDLEADGADATRAVVAVVDRYGARRGFAGGRVHWRVSGPATLVGDNPLDLGHNGGVGAVWLRTRRDRPGRIRLTAAHPALGSRSVTVTAH